MKLILPCALFCLLPLAAHAAQPWQEISLPTVAQAAANFPNPPAEYGAIHWAIWGGGQNKERIIADIDRIHAAGGTVYMINNSQRVLPKYLSPEYMDLVKAVVAECKKNGMKVWIETDCGYPDGFAGGAISKDYPQLGMKGIAIDARCTVAAGASLDIPLPADTLGILVRPAAAAAAETGESLPIPANGIFTYAAQRGHPAQIIVQLPTTDIRYAVSPGEPFSIPVPPGTKAILLGAGGGGGAAPRGARGGAGGTPATIIPLPANGNLKWTAPADQPCEISFVRHIYKTSPTRNDNGSDGGATKDTFYSLIDFLDPEACATFTRLIHETYAQAVGDEFGKTVLGFRGDETDFTNVMPWTPRLLDTFQKQKGYDLKPYIASFFVTPLTQDAQRAKADYWDVWSGMFRDTFYKQQQDWCRARGMDYMVHLNHEETMLGRNAGGGGESMTTNEGSFFRDMRYVGVPGVDNLNQIGPGIVADFPKLAGSAAHLFGRPQAWSEEGGALGSAGKFVFDYQLVRGINFMNIRGMTGQGGGGRGAAAPTDLSVGTGFYYTRAQYLMAIGRPAAQIALYHPSDSYWLADTDADATTVKLTTQLLEHQIDFDHIDHDTLATTCTLEGSALKNLSGQLYRAIIIPSSSVIQKSVLDRLRAFAAAGGKVIFVGRTPTMIINQTFLHPDPVTPETLSFATLEPTPDITEKVIAALPAPDFKLAAPNPAIKYMHRSLKDGDTYFLFNESADPQTVTASLRGTGDWQVWDAATGKITSHSVLVKHLGQLTDSLTLAPHESRFIILGPPPP